LETSASVEFGTDSLEGLVGADLAQRGSVWDADGFKVCGDHLADLGQAGQVTHPAVLSFATLGYPTLGYPLIIPGRVLKNRRN
jgi:hypothetical protein